jgi:hypothetical protein
MKYFLLVAALAFGAPLLAQDKPATAPDSAKPAAAPQEPAKAKPMARKHGPKHGEDARHCLDMPSNTEIIKCAEEYL